MRNLLHWKSVTDCYGLSTPEIRTRIRKLAISGVLRQKEKVSATTFALSAPPPQDTNKWFRMKRWVNDSLQSKVYSQFRVCHVQLGNRGPLPNGAEHKLCPLCLIEGKAALNNEVRSLYT